MTYLFSKIAQVGIFLAMFWLCQQAPVIGCPESAFKDSLPVIQEVTRRLGLSSQKLSDFINAMPDHLTQSGSLPMELPMEAFKLSRAATAININDARQFIDHIIEETNQIFAQRFPLTSNVLYDDLVMVTHQEKKLLTATKMRLNSKILRDIPRVFLLLPDDYKLRADLQLLNDRSTARMSYEGGVREFRAKHLHIFGGHLDACILNSLQEVIARTLSGGDVAEIKVSIYKSAVYSHGAVKSLATYSESALKEEMDDFAKYLMKAFLARSEMDFERVDDHDLRLVRIDDGKHIRFVLKN